MSTRTWVIGAVVISIGLAIGALYIAINRVAIVATAEIDALAQTKYSPRSSTVQLPIEIVGRKFEWGIRYPNSRRFQDDSHLVENFAAETKLDQSQAGDLYLVNELHVWKGVGVHIHLKSGDVLHTFSLPALRLMIDAVPGKVTPVWIEVTESNVTWDAQTATWKRAEKWEFVCAAHRSQGPTAMKGQLFVHETKDDFLKWLRHEEAARGAPP